jgi:hypothetical protein
MPRLRGVVILHASFEVVADIYIRGLLPDYPAEVFGYERPELRRQANLEESRAVEWVLAWRGSECVGYATYRDVYNYSSGYDGREIIGICGTQRAVFELLKHLRADAREHKRRCFGAVNLKNVSMRRALHAIGTRPTRIVYEDVAQ